MFRRLFCLALCVCFIIPLLSFNARADYTFNGEIVQMADWLIYKALWNAGAGFGNWMRSLWDDDACPNNIDDFEGRHVFEERFTQVDGVAGHYYICKYCGKSAGEVMEETYPEYVETLPATGITNSGGLYLTLPFASISGNYVFDTVCDDFYHAHARNMTEWTYSGSTSTTIFTFTFSTLSSFNGSVVMYSNPSFSMQRSDGVNSVADNVNCSLTNMVVDVGDTISGSATFNAGEIKGYQTVVFTVTELPVVLCTPFSGSYNVQSTSSNDTYNVYTRPASITGDYGIMTQSGDVQRIDSQSIVNETDNSVYNPVTNTTHTVTDWNYDYSDRSYHCTTQEGDTVTVTYGDEHITIQEGAETYNVYYLIESDSGSGSGGGSDTPAHTHDYSSTVTRAATCTRSGVRTYTCSGCNATYQETIPATGHNWELVQETHTNYNSDGTLSQQGYSVYQCSVCGEQYRLDDSAGLAVLPNTNVLDQTASDPALAEMTQKIQSWYTSLRAMYEGYVGFLSDAFPFLPQELVTMINFGFSSALFISLYRKLRG